MWAELAFGTILAICGFLAKRALDDIDSSQQSMNKRLYLQSERLRAIEKNQLIHAEKLKNIHNSLGYIKANVGKLEMNVENSNNLVSLRVKDLDQMVRKNQETLGKIIIIIKKAILKK